MKNLILICLLLSFLGCSKKNDNSTSLSNITASQIIGVWTSTSDSISYSLNNQLITAQNDDNTYTFDINADGTAKKLASSYGITVPVTVFSSTYTLTASGSKNFITFTINGTGSPANIDVYTINSISDNNLVLSYAAFYNVRNSEGIVISSINAIVTEFYSK